VLLVDDDAAVVETYALHLDSAYETRLAYSGEEALELLDDEVDAVLLDRRLPDIHGDEVLETIRDWGYDCPVIMATAADPDLNILEMDFDDYLRKPIFGDVLLDVLRTHLDTSIHHERLDEFLSLVSKTDVLEAQLASTELSESEEYQQAIDRARELAPQLRDQFDDFDELVATYRDIERKS
jgi:DNA-binding response OmpR family regulator